MALIAILTVIMAVVALKQAASVFVPFVFALFLIAVFWPVYAGITDRIGRAAGAILSLVALLAIMGGLGFVLYETGEHLVDGAKQYEATLSDMRARAVSMAKGVGLDISAISAGSGSAFSEPMKTAGEFVGGFLTGGTLAIAFFALGLLEVRKYGRRIQQARPDDYPKTRDIASEVAREFQRYVLVRTFIGLLTGASVVLAAWLVGLDFPFIWGLVNFLLNYIPTLGSILGVIPPTLFALVQFESFGMAALVLATVGGVQLIMGNYVDPIIQGKYMKLSPVVVLLAVTFFGWLWGVAGALIAVPLTVFIVIICRQFDSTRWIARVLARVEDEDDDDDDEQAAAAASDTPEGSPASVESGRPAAPPQAPSRDGSRARSRRASATTPRRSPTPSRPARPRGSARADRREKGPPSPPRAGLRSRGELAKKGTGWR